MPDAARRRAAVSGMPAGAAVAIRPQHPHTHARQRLFACTACGFPVGGDWHDRPVHPTEALQQPLGICRGRGAAAHSVCLLPVCRRDAAADFVRRARPAAQLPGSGRAVSGGAAQRITLFLSSHPHDPAPLRQREAQEAHDAHRCRQRRHARAAGIPDERKFPEQRGVRHRRRPRQARQVHSQRQDRRNAGRHCRTGTVPPHRRDRAGHSDGKQRANGEIFCSFAKRQAAA